MAVYLLTHDEQIRIDPTRLAQIYVEYGDEGADSLLGDAVEDMAMALSCLSRLGPHGSLTEIAKQADRVAQNASRCGMVDLARVAHDVEGAAAQIDFAALGATMARLGRVGDRSISALWGPCNASL